MAKLNRQDPQDSWTTPDSRQASALVDDPRLASEARNSGPASGYASDDDDAYLRPSAPQRRARRPRSTGTGTGRNAEPDLVPNYNSLEDAEDAHAYLRSSRRVSPRTGLRTGPRSGLRHSSRWRALLRTRYGRILLAALAVGVLVALGLGVWAVRAFLRTDSHFRIDSSGSIQTTGVTELTRPELLAVFGSDIGRNIFFVPLAAREAALEAQPWVRHATVMRILPDSLRVTIQERVPIAFVRIGRQIQLVDADGVLLTMPPSMLAARHYDFPVVTGLVAGADAGDSQRERARRMQLYQQFVSALNSGSSRISSQLSEVDLSDLDDVRAVVPAQGTDILLHFGNSDFLERYHAYLQHLPEWRQQYPNLSAVDLRYDRQVVLKMADAAQADQAAESAPLPAQAAASTPGAAHARPVRAAPHPPSHAHHPAHWAPHYIPHAGRAQ